MATEPALVDTALSERPRGVGAPLPWSRTRTLAAAGLLVVITAIAYVPSLGGGFLIDDDALVTKSRLIGAPDGIYRFWFTTEAVDYWPVSNTSLWLEWRLWGAQPLGYRVTNLALHLATALLLWAVLRGAAVPGAFAASLLFAVHPVNVETVAWIAQRKTLLALFFSLVAAWALLRSEQPRRSTAQLWWYAAAVVACALAILSKASAAVLPLLLLVMLAWMRPLSRRDLVRAVPFFAVTLLLSGANLWLRAHDPGVAPPAGTMLDRVLAAAAATWFYLAKAILPIDLMYMYPPLRIDAHRLASWAPLLTALVAVILFWRHRGRWGWSCLLAAIFYTVALLPALGFTHALVLEDHYQHLALVGVVALAGGYWDAGRRRAGPSLSAALTTVGVLVIAVFAVLTWRHAAQFTDSVVLTQAAADLEPDSAQARHNLGYALMQAGRMEEARARQQEAVALDPDYLDGRKELGAALLQLRRGPEAVEQFRAAVRINPEDAFANENLGSALRESGQPAEALPYLEKAARLNPKSARAPAIAGKALLDLGRPADATIFLEEAVRRDPGDTESRRTLERVQGAP